MDDAVPEARAPAGHLVVVGSSAGGIEALSILIGRMSPDFPAPIVLGQHLDPYRPSHLAQILERRTRLSVVTVLQRTRLEMGHVYVVPSDRHVIIEDAHVDVRGDSTRPRPSIDRLLSTAAQAYGERLVAVILTGSGSDGAAGAVEVKAQGGVVVIQNPETAAYPSMPLALPPTAVDHVADLPGIAALLRDLVTNGSVPEPAAPPEDLTAIMSVLGRDAGIDFRAYRDTTVVRRIGRRMAVTHTRNVGEYRRFLEAHPGEVVELVRALLINVTEFFRDAEAFAVLTTQVVPELVKRARGRDRALRLWSAGCATGEEPYSLALAIADHLGAELAEWTVKVFATDVDDASIDFARRGIYPPNVLRNLPDDYRGRFFEAMETGFHVSKVVRGMVIFGQQDLIRGAPFPRIDLVVCRNLLIYFKPELQQEILDRFAYSLAPTGGYLFLGKAETARPSRAAYELVNKKWRVYRCSESPGEALRHRRVTADRRSSVRPVSPAGRQGRPGPEAAAGDVRAELAGLRRFNERVLRHVPVGVAIIDRGYRILSMNGAARRLLGIREVPTNADFLHSVRGLPYPQVRQAVDDVFRSRTTVTLPAVHIDSAGGEQRHVALSFSLVQAEEEADNAAVTVWDASELVDVRQRLESLETEQKVLIDELGTGNRRLQALNKELQDSNEELQASNEELTLAQEELQASNEEFEASNEELQATNEELETSNEELQATNEELVTTNDELTARTLELQELARILSGDRLRVAATADLAPFYVIVLRGRELRIESLSPAAGRLFGGANAIGSSFEEACAAANLHALAAAARNAVEKDTPWASPRMEALVGQGEEAAVERGFIFTLVPARAAGGSTDGVVVYAEDVTERTAVEQEASRERLRLMVEHAEQVALALFHAGSGALLYASPRYLDLVERSSGVPREEIAGRRWHELAFMTPAEEAWTVFQDVVRLAEPARMPEVRRAVGAGQETVWDCSLIPIATRRGEETVEYVLVSAVEVTEQVRAREELQRLARIKDEFLTLASHELRTPLVPLTAYSEVMARLAAEPEKTPEWERRFTDVLDRQRRQLQYLGRMTDDILDVGRLQNRKLTLNSRPVDLTALLPQALHQARTLRPEQPLKAEMPDGDPLVILGDEGRLTQVLMNLLENAFKYGDHSADVVLRLSRDGASERSWAEIHVEDRGPGIPAPERPSLFTPFFQGARKDRPSRGGLGLGLYIARGIVEQHGGTIDVDPSWEQGARIRIRLPLASG